MKRRFWMGLTLGLIQGVMAVGLAACGSVDADTTGMGATPGGAQDNALADKQIDQGGVPRSSAFTVEGLLNSHDLPLEGATCEKALCINAAYGVAPTLDTDRSAVFVQMGLSSGINQDSFVRQPLDLAVVVDRSGSMMGEKIRAVRTAMGKLIDQLNEGDRLSIVLFDDRVSILVPSTAVTDKVALKAKVAEIVERGATNMEAGLAAGYEQLSERAGTPGVSSRVMLFTDAQTNTGEVKASTFVSLTNQNAAKGIGLTVFGVGTDLNQDLVLSITQLKGGNYFFLADTNRVATVFDKDFDYLVTPLAYDLRFHLEPSAGFRVAQVYGYSSWKTGLTSVDIEAASVFLSRNHGAMVVRLEPTTAWPSGKPPVAELSLSYSLVSENEKVTSSWSAAYEEDRPLAEDTVYYSQRAVRKTVALVNSALAMRRASDLYYSNQGSAAIALLDRSAALLHSEGETIEDVSLMQEAQRTERLATNMESGATSSNGGGYYIDDSDDGHWNALCSVGGAGATQSPSGTVPRVAFLFGAAALGLGAVRRRRRVS